MVTTKHTFSWSLVLLVALSLLSANASFAGFGGHNMKGDFGVLSGTQPPPGFYAVPIYYGYEADSLRDRDGDKITIDPQE